MSAADGYGLYSTILPAWASALLVFQSWAMRRPLYVGRATVRVPRFFYVPIGSVYLNFRYRNPGGVRFVIVKKFSTDLYRYS